MSGKAALEKKLDSLRALRDSPETAEKELRRALQDKNGFYVSKAAAIAGELQLRALVPDLEAAFDRFLKDPVKTDPQCWAKIAIVKALRAMEHKESRTFLRGWSHIQKEPVWGGEVDTAAPLRGACAISLVQCQLSDLEILSYLTAGLADPEKNVRVDTAAAIGALGSEAGALLLRLKALLGDKEPEALGQCFTSLLDLGPAEGVPFVARFLSPSHGEEVQAEAVAALAQVKAEQAIEFLREAWKQPMPSSLKKTLVLSLAGSPLPSSADFLLTVLAEGSDEVAIWALEALDASRFRSQVYDRIKTVVEQAGEGRLRETFSSRFA